MPEVAIEISGVLYDKLARTRQNVTLRGKGLVLSVDEGGGGDGDHIWGGGNVPMPNPPIANVPGAPGYRPPGDHIWGGGNVPMPSPPIANVPGLPPMPDQPPDVPPDAPPGTVVKPPPSDGGWSFVVPYGWGYFPGQGQAGPKG